MIWKRIHYIRVILLKQKIHEEKKSYHKIEMALQNQFTRIKLLVRNNIFDMDSNRLVTKMRSLSAIKLIF